MSKTSTRLPVADCWQEIDVQHSRVSSIPALHLERFKKVMVGCMPRQKRAWWLTLSPETVFAPKLDSLY